MTRPLLASMLLLFATPLLAQEDVPGFVRLARLADVDGDGVKDVVVMCAQEGWDPASLQIDARKDTLHVFLGKGGKLVAQPPIVLPSPASSFWVLDVTGDKVPDILILTRAGIVLLPAAGGAPIPFLDDAFLHEDYGALDLEAAHDVDGDGVLDLVLPTATGVSYHLWREGSSILEGQGADLPVKAVNLEAEAPTLFAKVAAEGAPPRLSFLRPIPQILDLDGDGRQDAVLPLAARLAEIEGIKVRFGEEGAIFGKTERAIELPHKRGEVLSDDTALAFGDLDGDGIMELGLLTTDVEQLSLRETRRLRVIHFDKSYVPDPEPLLDVATDANLWEPSRLSLSDQDGDGMGDVLVTHIGGLRKTSFTAELYRRKPDGRFEKVEETLKIGKDEKIDRSFLPAPADLDGDGVNDFLVAGKAVVYELAGVFRGGAPFTDPARKVTRVAGADKVLAVLVDGRPKGPSPYYVLTRQTSGKNLLTRVLR